MRARAVAARGARLSRLRTVPGRKRMSLMKVMPARNLRENAFVKLKYVQCITLSTSATYSGEHAFRINSIYDPDYTGTGHQPYYHDQLQTLWKYYEVKGCKIKTTFTASGGTGNTILYYRFGPNMVAVSTTNAAVDLENGNMSKYRHIPANQSAVGVGRNWTLKAYVPMKHFMRDLNPEDKRAQFGANPTHAVYGVVGFGRPDAISTQSYYCTVELTFFAKLSTRLTQAVS